ncbi:MAG: 6-bladed beta-propeller [Candidatus Aminicenantes bacterium]|nr:6-bladed beta-propeller [Candidatus Aminicenantes bacterium]NIM84849.1 6-bladed beta-propeller [Candidatus Aminicenantes bacterium]NIN24357.1 6-bladed beta-propeller [Candidatus Aminicenantes bacterium]NIN48121.1 6-bladed beta-propeller [Candidatus Aminicenantes bacterium]NIN91019.1 6-bladed beta-propeller [Candidatus Aminicenantes bacterium]
MRRIFFFICFTAILVFLFFFPFEKALSQEKSAEGGNTKIVKNRGSGLWVEKGKKAIFNKKLSIGVFEGNENEMFHKPMDVTSDDHGNIYVLDTGNCRIQKFDREGNYLLTIGKKGEGPGEILNSWDIELDSKGNIVVFDWVTNRISKFDSQGTFIGSFQVKVQARYGVLDSKDNIYLYSMNKGKLIHKYSPGGEFLFSFMETLESKQKRTEAHINSLGRIGMTKDDKIYLALTYPYTVYIFNKEGRLLKKIVTETDYAVPPHITPSNIVITNFFIIGLDISPQGYIFCRTIFFNVLEKFEPLKLKNMLNSLYQDYSYVDIFDPGGNFLVHQKVKGFSWGGYFDQKGDYYGIEEGETCFKAVKYSVQF